MSEEKTLIQKVAALVLEKDTKIKLAEVTTADGVVLRYENLEAGTAIMVVDSEGVETPADGDYALEDGSVISTSEGLVVEVKEVEEKEEEEMDEEVNPLEEKVAALENTVNEILEKFTAYEIKFNEFSKKPADKELNLSKKENKISSKETAIVGLSKYRKK